MIFLPVMSLSEAPTRFRIGFGAMVSGIMKRNKKYCSSKKRDAGHITSSTSGQDGDTQRNDPTNTKTKASVLTPTDRLEKRQEDITKMFGFSEKEIKDKRHDKNDRDRKSRRDKAFLEKIRNGAVLQDKEARGIDNAFFDGLEKDHKEAVDKAEQGLSVALGLLPPSQQYDDGSI